MTLLLDWLLVFLPILSVLVLMLRFRWDGAQAGAAGWPVALAVAALRFGASWQVLAYAQAKKTRSAARRRFTPAGLRPSARSASRYFWMSKVVTSLAERQCHFV